MHIALQLWRFGCQNVNIPDIESATWPCLSFLLKCLTQVSDQVVSQYGTEFKFVLKLIKKRLGNVIKIIHVPRLKAAIRV